MTPRPYDDDMLLDDLRHALAGSRSPAAEQMAAGARAAFSFLTMDEELAALSYDSLQDSGLVGAGRAPTAARTVVFESGTVSVEMDITDEGIVGQVIPSDGARVSAEAPDGTRTEIATDELGCFTLPTPGRSAVRLHVSVAGASAVTEWTHLDRPS